MSEALPEAADDHIKPKFAAVDSPQRRIGDEMTIEPA